MIVSQSELTLKYGLTINGVWDDEDKWCTIYKVPQAIAPTFINSVTKKPTVYIYCNRDLIPLLSEAFSKVIDQKLEYQLKTFDGCYALRDVRGIPGVMSYHSRGLAIDINAATNRLGTFGNITPELAACFTDAGFTHGRNFKRLDPMHFSLGG